MSTFLDPAALMRIKSLELWAKVYWCFVSTRSECVAELGADAAGGRCVRRSVGFASRSDVVYPGSPRLGSADPGLYYAAPLELVCGGVGGRKSVSGGQEDPGRTGIWHLTDVLATASAKCILAL